jgi:AcrR family transcriptional regulator
MDGAVVTDVPPQRGRPRRAESTEAIVRAAFELLGEVGYDDLHMQTVAERAKVSLATIYRRWPTKQALIADAFRRIDPLEGLTDTGDPRADLAAGMRAYARSLTARCADRRCQNFFAVLRAEPEIAAAYADHVSERLRSRLREIIAKVVGPDDPFLDVRADLGPALLTYRAEVLGNLDDPDAAGDEVAALMLADRPTGVAGVG